MVVLRTLTPLTAKQLKARHCMLLNAPQKGVDLSVKTDAGSSLPV